MKYSIGLPSFHSQKHQTYVDFHVKPGPRTGNLFCFPGSIAEAEDAVRPRLFKMIAYITKNNINSLPDNELVLQWTENGVGMLEASQDGQNKFELLTPIITKHMSLKYSGPADYFKNCSLSYCYFPHPTIPTEKHKDSDSNQILKNYSEAPTNANNAKNKKKNKKRKINKKDSVEDFVFPKKTARPVSPLPSEPITVNKSFSYLESENDKDQVAPEENNETAPPKPKPLPPIQLKIKKNIRDQLKSIYQKFPDITNKSSGEFIKLITNDIEEYHALTNFLEKNKDFEFFSLKPKPIKPIKIVIKGLPIFTKTHEIQSDLEEEGFTIENVSQLISKKTKTTLPFFQVTLPRHANNKKNLRSQNCRLHAS
ncbi:uncharacterized protein TNCV_1087191 [Trichonephila clavipes]|nr:uncharacterized protein TNCV_1087191 [Trichonephila clavipes]